MISPLIVLAALIVVLAGIVAFYVLGPRYGPHYTSKLSCPKCGKTFEYRWIPGGSVTALKDANKRYLRCPFCHEWSTFDVVSTRTDNKSK